MERLHQTKGLIHDGKQPYRSKHSLWISNPVNNELRIRYIENQTELLKELEKVNILVTCLRGMTSAFRCPEVNQEVGGKEKSKHQVGKAIDVKMDFYPDLIVIREIWELCGHFCYEYEKNGNKYLHLEV